MLETLQELVIVGASESGRVFRPSDWADRLCGCLSIFSEDQRIQYSPYVKPILSEGIKCVVVDRRLEALNSAAFAFLMSFASDNQLFVREGRQALRPEEAAATVNSLPVQPPVTVQQKKPAVVTAGFQVVPLT